MEEMKPMKPMKRKCNKCGVMRTEEEYYNPMRKICCYCHREMSKEYKRAHSKTWKGERKFFKPINRRVKKDVQIVQDVQIVEGMQITKEIQITQDWQGIQNGQNKPVKVRNIPESVRFHVDALKRLGERQTRTTWANE